MKEPWSPQEEPLDLLGIGIGPFNLSVAALADQVPGLRTAFLEQKPRFDWHPGMLIEGATLQVPFLADLVSLVEPSSPWSFLSYLKSRKRLFPFFFSERPYIYRAEYDAYCRWVADELPHCHFGYQVNAIAWDDAQQVFTVDYVFEDPDGEDVNAGSCQARNLVLGIGTAPAISAAVRHLYQEASELVLHSADYLSHREELLSKQHITVVGSGQSGAEVFLDLLKSRPTGREGLHWIARTPAFTPMEYSKLGLEQFTPEYVSFFHQLPESARDRLSAEQWRLYKGISTQTIGEIHDELYRRSVDADWPDATLLPATQVVAAQRRQGRIELEIEHTQQGGCARVITDALVLATGYRERPTSGLLEDLAPRLVRDSSGRALVDRAYRLVCEPRMPGSVFVQNAERHTHGASAPDLGMGAYRAATIVNAVTGRETFRLPARSAFTTFGLAQTATDASDDRVASMALTGEQP
ncbi:lysine N(6)-hydroxylase/L-ornithine N(5)-oxygenase family protein [Streptomyces sp. KR80]|uniref:lysine N(6)-hydroxylase/L-ornithine N(5)-oxygenase family protein n=1 Tax=Streptomyces sp. KR80 TaxID=3457426 RepID=UPI003FD0C435